MKWSVVVLVVILVLTLCLFAYVFHQEASLQKKCIEAHGNWTGSVCEFEP